MTNFELVQNLLQRLEQMESELKSLRDNTGQLSKEAINSTLSTVIDLNQNLWKIDKSLADENMGDVIYNIN